MNTREYIDSLFSDYQKTSALEDFKEELKSFLDERIRTLVKGGMDEKDAFEKATSELGDISAVADEISRKKKQELIGEMYLKTTHYMSTWRIALYVLCGAVFGFGVIVAAISEYFSGDVNAPLGSLLVFGGIPILVFLFLWLTQETATREAMEWKRALLYVVTAGVFLFGVFVFLVTYFEKSAGLPYAIATLIPFVLPSSAFGVFLILTEKDRSKPWVIKQREEYMKRSLERFGDPVQEMRFGLFSAALWIAGIAAFILLTILFGFKFSWLAIVAALIGQMLILATFTKSH
ncbi:MAG TPA: permease prefix domain 1-containing protein [Syntrophomonadaceae bacterium]|mgnify:CR=1 FL=1|nr:hypothetical protein [Syntrophomonadaceae bacterium]HOQ10592.1 permease prefix domain 1-containing protein [Syntrophomonadaceae bacterium]HPU49706.1 permease prefix domain 1-containing protein [Syntrophomonadaceae bacterium]